MKRNASGVKLLTEQRRNKIVDKIQSLGLVAIDELVAELGVSQMTIWRDLIALEQDGKVRRVRGGVARVENETNNEPLYRSKLVLQKDLKSAIARLAAETYVRDNDIIFLEAGTTVGSMIEFLNQRDLTVISNGLGNLNQLSSRIPEMTVLSCGGMLRYIAHTFVGPQAVDFFHNMRANTLFLGCTGLDFPDGITDPNPLEIQVKRAMVESAGQTVLLIDSTKFGVRSLSQIIPFERVKAVITDDGVPDKYVSKLREMHITVHIVTP